MRYQQLRPMRRLTLMTPERQRHFTLWNVGSQQLQVAFDGGRLVSDAGLLGVRALEKPLRVIADLAQRLPDPRSRKYVTHSAEGLCNALSFRPQVRPLWPGHTPSQP